MKIDLAFLFKRSELKRRVFSLAGLGAIAVLFIVGISDFLAIREAVSDTIRDRFVLTRVLGNQIERLMKENLSALENVPLTPGFDLQHRELSLEKNALHNASLQSICQTLFLLDSSGNLLWTEPRRNNLDIRSIPAAREILNSGKPFVTELIEGKSPRDESVFLLVPIMKDAQFVGIIGGRIENLQQQFASVLKDAFVGHTGYAEIVDGHGRVIASDRKGLSKIKEFSTSVPLSIAPWNVVVRQAEGEVWAAVTRMKFRFFLFGSLLLIIVSVLTIGLAYSLIVPVQRLTESAKRIAAGDFREAVPVFGTDEIGELGEAFDEMRIRLDGAIKQIDKANEELEKRVDVRTREVFFLCEELKRKEEAKGDLLRKIITAQEEERKRIARELHDELSQDLAVLSISLGGETISSTKTEQMKQLVARASDKVHRIMFDLRPSILDDLGLFSALKWYAEDRLVSRGISVHFEGESKEQRLSPQTETALFRIAQEAITNIVRHSGAENVMICLEWANQTLRLEIEDDGKGFDPDSSSTLEENGAGMGLLGMKERALLCKGMCKVESKSGSGTRILVEVPAEEIYGQVQQDTTVNC